MPPTLPDSFAPYHCRYHHHTLTQRLPYSSGGKAGIVRVQIDHHSESVGLTCHTFAFLRVLTPHTVATSAYISHITPSGS